MARHGPLPSGWALVFDLDGVIIDSNPTHTEAWRRYLNSLGIQCDDIEARMHGRRNDEIVADFIGTDLTPEQVFAHGAAKERLYRELMRAELESRLVPGIREFLEWADSVPLAVASNAEPANVEFVLDSAGLRRWFDVIVDGHQVQRPKPYPDIYELTAKLLGIPPDHCIIFEDSPPGVAAGRTAGSKVVGVLTLAGSLPGVDFAIRDFCDPALKSWFQAVFKDAIG
jgi:HAD superfamily hydrolase (TIGR01509 family)